MKRCIITYAEGAHEELIDVALPTYKNFAVRHGYDIQVGEKLTERPPAWNKVHLLLDALTRYEEVVWFDCDMIVVDPSEDFPPLEKLHSLVRHFEGNSEVPNSGVWRMRRCDIQGATYSCDLLNLMLKLEVFTNHGWWEQAALMTLMGYIVPPEGSKFSETKCRNVYPTKWYDSCQFMRLRYNSHPNYRADKPVIVHCSYPNMPQRLHIMRELVDNPCFDYPKYEVSEKEEDDV